MMANKRLEIAALWKRAPRLNRRPFDEEKYDYD